MNFLILFKILKIVLDTVGVVNFYKVSDKFYKYFENFHAFMI